MHTAATTAKNVTKFWAQTWRYCFQKTKV